MKSTNANSRNNEDQWLKTKEAADFLGVTTRTIANYRERGQIPFAQVGRVIRYRKEDLNQFLMEHYVQPFNCGRAAL